MAQAELIQLNTNSTMSQEEREFEEVYTHYKLQDILYRKYKVEEEQVKKVLAEHGMMQYSSG
jgi:hypothetical protein